MARKYEYNKANLITGVTNINNKNVKTSYRYSYYPDGNIAHYVNHYNATMDYTYDSANRVVKEVYGEDANMPFTIGYTYDEFGNLSKKDYRDDDNPAYVTTYSYDKNNRLTKESQIVSNGSTKWQNITTYGYDKNGNRLNRVEYKNKNVDSNKFNLGMIDVGSNSKGTGYKYSDYGKEVYTYDGLNELKSYRGKNEQNATYEYMPNHYRISKTVDGTKTYQLWDNDRVVSEFDSELNMKINYRIGTNGQILTDSNENSYSYDGHGNLVNAKSSYSTCVYDAYGNRIEDFGIGDAPFGYCGEYTDKESGLVYLRNRYYDSSTGSFITEDPIKDGNNWYGYCAGNPVNGWDTSGLVPVEYEKNLTMVAKKQEYDTDCWAAVYSSYVSYIRGKTDLEYLKDIELDILEKVAGKGSVGVSTAISQIGAALGKNVIDENLYKRGFEKIRYGGDYTDIPVLNLKAEIGSRFGQKDLGRIIKEEIDNDRPVILLYRTGNAGHFVIVNGYKSVDGEVEEVNYINTDRNLEGMNFKASLSEMATSPDGVDYNLRYVYTVNDERKLDIGEER